MHRVQHTEHVARVSGPAMAALLLRLCAVLALGVVTLLVFPDRAAYAATPTAAQKTVLILNSERREFPAVIAFEAGLREGIDNADGNITLHFEYLDLGRFPSEQA